MLDLSKVIAGPLCTQFLGDLGAEIIKVESRDGGDDTRRWMPLRGDTGAAFLSLNRNKKSIALDLKDPEGQAIVARLAARSDIVVESFAPDVKARLGVDFATLGARQPAAHLLQHLGLRPDGPAPIFARLRQYSPGPSPA